MYSFSSYNVHPKNGWQCIGMDWIASAPYVPLVSDPTTWVSCDQVVYWIWGPWYPPQFSVFTQTKNSFSSLLSRPILLPTLSLWDSHLNFYLLPRSAFRGRLISMLSHFTGSLFGILICFEQIHDCQWQLHRKLIIDSMRRLLMSKWPWHLYMITFHLFWLNSLLAWLFPTEI